MKILSVDLGDARTGIAVCDKSEIIASPVTVINESYQPKIIAKIAVICDELRPEMIVVGNPINMDGSAGDRSKKCCDFAAELEKETGIKTAMWDERSTTVIAHGILNENDICGKKRKSVVDAVAATVILESYISYRKNSKK